MPEVLLCADPPKSAKFVSRLGKIFGKLTVVEYAGKDAKKRLYWRCLCSCGNEAVVLGNSLITGNTSSCGCGSQSSRFPKSHGLTGDPLFHAWMGMMARCYNPECPAYPNYGGRGIRVHSALQSAEGYVAYITSLDKPRSDKLSIDRIDNEGDYAPGNLRWATRREQSLNRRNTLMVSHNGNLVPLIRLTEAAGVNYYTARIRLKRGCSLAAILSKSRLTSGQKT